MKIEFLPHYGHPFKAHPYTHHADTDVKSLGTFYGKYKIPALYVTADYYFIQKTGLPSDDVKLTFRPNGPCDAILNFPHAEVDGKWHNGNLYIFKVMLHALYNSDIKIRETYKGEGKLGVDIKKIVTVEGGGSYERSYESRETPVMLHAQYNGVLYAKQSILTVGGGIR